MRLTEEQVLQDDKRFESRNALAELKYCGWEIPQRRAITNDEIRFYAWLCRSAVALLKEQEPIEPVDDGHGSLICGNQGYECGCVGRYDLTTKVVEKYCNFCPECGRKVKWE